jgi:hypothetical protein
MALNIFSDPKLRTRQDQLDGQWYSLLQVVQFCDNVPDSSFSNFTSDLRAWQAFYESGSDWSSSSENATNDWQAKALEWSKQLNAWGCTGNISGSDSTQSGIPGVKTPPPDQGDFLDKAVDAAKGLADKATGPLDAIWNRIATVGWVALGLIVLILGLAVYSLTHVKANTPYGSVG